MLQADYKAVNVPGDLADDEIFKKNLRIFPKSAPTNIIHIQ